MRVPSFLTHRLLGHTVISSLDSVFAVHPPCPRSRLSNHSAIVLCINRYSIIPHINSVLFRRDPASGAKLNTLASPFSRLSRTFSTIQTCKLYALQTPSRKYATPLGGLHFSVIRWKPHVLLAGHHFWKTFPTKDHLPSRGRSENSAAPKTEKDHSLEKAMLTSKTRRRSYEEVKTQWGRLVSHLDCLTAALYTMV